MEVIKLWLADIEELAQYEQEALALVTPARRAEAGRIKPLQDRLHCIAAGLLLRHVLGIASDAEITQDQFGKRSLTGEGPHFNLSHGGKYAVLALSDGPVGVDIEPVGDRIPIAIPRRYLLPDELAWLEAEQTPERFARLWTRLESVLKADGRGFSLGKRDFSVLSSGDPWYLETFLYDGHCISCASGKPFKAELNQLPAQLLLVGKKP